MLLNWADMRPAPYARMVSPVFNSSYDPDFRRRELIGRGLVAQKLGIDVKNEGCSQWLIENKGSHDKMFQSQPDFIGRLVRKKTKLADILDPRCGAPSHSSLSHFSLFAVRIIG